MAQLFPLWAYTACRSLNYLAHIILFLADTPKIKKKNSVVANSQA